MTVVFTFIPSRIFIRLGLSGPTGWHANVLLSHFLLAIGIMLTPALSLVEVIPHECLSKTVLGVPCPGCGVTTCLKAVSSGEIRKGLDANPAGFGLLAGLGVQIGLHALALGRPASREAITRHSRFVGRVVLSWLLVVWIVRVVPCLL